MKVVVIDSGPASLLVQRPDQGADARLAHSWLASLFRAEAVVMLPEIVDYELRRELIRLGKWSSVARLDALIARTFYIPINTQAMRRAAELWAQLRISGKPTADRHALDGDVILAAQALTSTQSDELVVATTNARHLQLMVPAADWRDITP